MLLPSLAHLSFVIAFAYVFVRIAEPNDSRRTKNQHVPNYQR